MPSEREAVQQLHSSLLRLPAGRWLVAVSGGRDSMALLEALRRCRPGEIAAVATFDHGTGPTATEAAGLVARTAASHGLPLLAGRAPAGGAGTEAAWRSARWAFLLKGAERTGATVLTAHTRDDQVETVLMRLLRGAGARGLAGMSEVDPHRPIRRPLLRVSRAIIDRYASSQGVRWVEDPSNQSRQHLRNRVRHELLPALEAAHPGFGDWCMELSLRCARWRSSVDRIVEGLGAERIGPSTATLPAEPLRAIPAEGQAILWPAVAALAGLTLDHRSTRRLSAWAGAAEPGQWIPLAAGGRVERNAVRFVVRGVAFGVTVAGNDGARS